MPAVAKAGPEGGRELAATTLALINDLFGLPQQDGTIRVNQAVHYTLGGWPGRHADQTLQ